MSYEEFYKQNYSRALYLSRNVLRSEDDAYDLVAELFLRVSEKYNTIENPVHYFNAALTHEIRNFKRKKQKSLNAQQELSEDLPDNSYLSDELNASEKEKTTKTIRAINKVLSESDLTTQLIFKAKILGKVDDKSLMNEFKLSKVEYTQLIKSTQNRVKALLS